MSRNFSSNGNRRKRRPCMDGARVARANLTFCEAFGCSHVYGLFSRGGSPHRDAAAAAAGPDVIRGSGPNQFHAFLPRVAHKRVFPIDGLDRFASMSSSPLQFLNALTQPILPSASSRSRCRKPSRSTGLAADQQRPGDAGHFVGKRNRDNLERSPCQKLRDPWKFLRVALGPAQDRNRSDHKDASQVAVALLDIGPSFAFPPVDICRGTSPIQAAKSRPDRKILGFVTVAAIADAPITPIPGMV